MGEALGKSCDNFSTHVCVASAVSIAASVITEPPGRWSRCKKWRTKVRRYKFNRKFKNARLKKAGGRYKVKSNSCAQW
jgi:hypothetical protein